MIKVPKDEKLKKYEFFLKVRHRSIVKFKSPSFLIDHPGRYQLSKEEEEKLDTYLLEKYYKPIQKEEDAFLPEPPGKFPKENIRPDTKQKPPFDLFIEDDLNND